VPQPPPPRWHGRRDHHDTCTTPHAADTGQMTRPLLADRIAGNDQRLAAGGTNQDPDLGY